jgi:hypothetical protein
MEKARRWNARNELAMSPRLWKRVDEKEFEKGLGSHIRRWDNDFGEPVDLGISLGRDLFLALSQVRM